MTLSDLRLHTGSYQWQLHQLLLKRGKNAKLLSTKPNDVFVTNQCEMRLKGLDANENLRVVAPMLLSWVILPCSKTWAIFPGSPCQAGRRTIYASASNVGFSPLTNLGALFPYLAPDIRGNKPFLRCCLYSCYASWSPAEWLLFLLPSCSPPI